MVLSSCIDAAQEKKKKHLKMSDNYFAFGRNSFYLYKRDRETRYIQNYRTDRYRLSVLDANHSTPANFGGRIHNQHKFPPDKFRHRTTLLCIDDIFHILHQMCDKHDYSHFLSKDSSRFRAFGSIYELVSLHSAFAA